MDGRTSGTDCERILCSVAVETDPFSKIVSSTCTGSGGRGLAKRFGTDTILLLILGLILGLDLGLDIAPCD